MDETRDEIYTVDSLIKNNTPPLIAHFENGELTSDIKLKYHLYTNKKRAIATISTENMIYTSTVNDTDENLFSTYLAIADKRTKKMRLVEVQSALFSPTASHSLKAHMNPVPEKTDTRGKLTVLNKTFGSKKIQRSTEQMERIKKHNETVCEELENTICDMEVIADETGQETTNSYLPTINRNASVVTKVYEINNLVPNHILNELDASVLNDDNISELQEFSQQMLHQHKSDESNETHKKLVLVLDCLIKFAHSSAKNIALKGYSPCNFCSALNTFILESFTQKSGTSRTRPLTMRDKCCCYIIVISIILGNYSLNIADISKVLKIGNKKTLDLCKFLYLTTNKNGAVQLKLPLPSTISQYSHNKKSKQFK